MLKHVCAFEHCKNAFVPRKSTQLYCCANCRAKAHNLAKKTGIPTAKDIKPAKPVRALELVAPAPEGDAPAGRLEASTVAELARLQAAGSPRGELALHLARMIDAPPPGTLSSVAGWSGQYRATLEAIEADARERGVLVAERPESELDRIRARMRAM